MTLDRCEQTGKVIYWTERNAAKAISRADLRGELPAMRPYRCPSCERWHLSRKVRRVEALVVPTKDTT